MRQVFWTFPDGCPGAALLLMRLATGSVLLHQALAEWPDKIVNLAAARSMAEGLAALFLIAGVGTPFWGAATVAIELWRIYSGTNELLTHALLATLAASLALLGAGAISVDAWLFGWRRIDVAKARKVQNRPPE